jgi:hypothetical protein
VGGCLGYGSNEVAQLEEDNGEMVGEGRERLIIELHLRLHESNLYATFRGEKSLLESRKAGDDSH